VRLQRIKERWEREVLTGLQRQERRFERARRDLAPVPLPRRRERDEERPDALLPFRNTLRPGGQLELFGRTKRSLRIARGNGWVSQWLRFGRRGRRWERDPEGAARRAVFRLASRAMPRPLRDAIWVLRGLREVGVHER
jgi:hypothetical protein